MADQKPQIGDRVLIVTSRTSKSKAFVVKVSKLLGGMKVSGHVLTGPLAGSEVTGEVREFNPKVEAEKKKKKCKCAAGVACDCWAFAPLYGDGNGHSGATFPKKDAVIPQDQHELPRGTPREGDHGSGVIDGGAPAAAPVTASCDDPEEDPLDEKTETTMRSGLKGLNEGLDFMTRVIAAPAQAVIVPDPDDDPNTNPMLADVDGELDPLDPLDIYSANVSETDSAYVGPMTMDDLTADMDAMDAALDVVDAPMMDVMDPVDCDDMEPSGEDVLQAVLTLLNAAMGF